MSEHTRTILGLAPALMACAALLLLAQTSPPQTPPSAAPATGVKPVSFETDVQPVLTAKCTVCHGPDTRVKEMNLSTLDGVMKGSESGPVIVPGKPDESKLYQMVRDGKMPPGKTHLSEQTLASIRSWIESLAASSPKVTSAPHEEV